MAALSLRRSVNCPQLYRAEEDVQPLLFLLPRGASAPDVLDLPASWAIDPVGCFIFLPAKLPAQNDTAFAESAWNFLDDRRRQGARVAWFENPNEVGQPVRGSFLALFEKGDAWLTDRLAPFDFGGLLLLIEKNCIVTLAPDTGGLHIAPSVTGRNALVTPAGTRYPLDGAISLPLAGPAAGALRGALTLRNAGISDGLADLDVGLRIFIDDGGFPAIDGQTFVTSMRYPVLSESADDWSRHGRDLRLYPTLAPLAPLDGRRSYLAFIGPAGGSPTLDLPSSYRTNLGYTIHLTPRDHMSRLVFAVKPAANPPDDAAVAYYLVPAGEFAITVPRFGPGTSEPLGDYADNLLCGLAGVEYVKLDPDCVNLLCFLPGRPAFAPGFWPEAPSAGGRTEGVLTDLATSAWAYLRNVDPANGTAVVDCAPLYYAQPDQAVLYAPADPGSGTSALLSFMEVPSAPLPDPAPEDTPAFPLFPYGGVHADAARAIGLDDYRQIELQRLVPTRRAQIQTIARGATQAFPKPRHPGTSAVDGDGTLTGTTPQGLLATFTDGYETVKTLYLAKDTGDAVMAFENIARGSVLRAALQSNQVFLVISDPAAIQPVFTRHALTIQGWAFDLDPAGWDQHGTLLVIKFHDKPMRDLADDARLWAFPEQFNRRPAATRRQLIKVLDDALARVGPAASAKDQGNYAQLARAASDPAWSGIIALNVSLTSGLPAKQQAQIVRALPEDLAALAGGIDPKRFMGQYVGVATTPIMLVNGRLEAGRSSLFGLIDYCDDGAPMPSESGFNFQVTRLQVLFGNSQIMAFASEISATLDRLFGERTALIDSAGGRNIVRFKGSAEDHDGHTTYAFSFSGENRFALPDSPVLNEIEIVKAQFATDPLAAAQPATVTGRFSFWGRMNFRRLPKFDVFSFGAEDGADGGTPDEKSLSFAKLVVTMSFPVSDAQQRSFAFDPGGLIFDLKHSKVRETSLYAKFPLKLTGLRHSAGDKPLSGCGYMPVKTPLGGAKIESGVWYALTFDLDLGSGGALAGQAGLVAGIAAAWQPGQPGVFVGLRLPGSSGDKLELALQGVLKIVFKSIEFVGPDPENPATYLLKLKNIQLKFMLLSMPPNGQTEIIIFGDPKASADSPNKTVGWYAAYATEPPARSQDQIPPPAEA